MKTVQIMDGAELAVCVNKPCTKAAKRCKDVEHVYLVYRRTKRYMPADERELQLDIEDGVEFRELLAPVKMENGTLLCNKMALSQADASGRAGVEPTGETELVPADTVIAAVGEKIPTDYYEANGIHVDENGHPLVSSTLETVCREYGYLLEVY